MRSATSIRKTIWSRCHSPNHSNYRMYGGKGIKCELTSKDIQFLIERDNATNMKRPSIDRIDSKKSYTVKNCRFIELSDNCSHGSLGKYKYKASTKSTSVWNSLSVPKGVLKKRIHDQRKRENGICLRWKCMEKTNGLHLCKLHMEKERTRAKARYSKWKVERA